VIRRCFANRLPASVTWTFGLPRTTIRRAAGRIVFSSPGLDPKTLLRPVLDPQPQMKPWLRLTLITTTVGGGFAGFVVTLDAFRSQGYAALNVLLISVFLVLFGSSPPVA
jgi:hypothetical protein